MRQAFINTLVELAATDSRIWLLTGDLGYSVLEPFRERYPERFVNVGVAEQNLIGVAAGLALAGKIVAAYSIVNFPVMRALEQIRNDVAYHNLPVIIVTVGGGMVYGAHGYTHHGAEDVGVMRLLPNMRVIVPADPVEVAWATRSVCHQPGPTYLRLARGGEPPIHDRLLDETDFGVPIELRGGMDLTIAVAGPLATMAIRAADECRNIGIQVTIFSVPSLVPLQADAILASAERTGRLLVIEDHGRGGLGTILAERLTESGIFVAFRSLHYQREPVTTAGDQDALRQMHGITKDNVIDVIRSMVAG